MSKILIGITLIVLLGVVGFAALSNSGTTPPASPASVSDSTNTTNTSTSTNTTGTTGTAPATTPSGYTMAIVATHSNATSCWTVVNGNVYDLTKWIDQHPGGSEAILSICGKDGSAAFNDQHGGQRRPANELAGFELGPLSK